MSTHQLLTDSSYKLHSEEPRTSKYIHASARSPLITPTLIPQWVMEWNSWQNQTRWIFNEDMKHIPVHIKSTWITEFWNNWRLQSRTITWAYFLRSLLIVPVTIEIFFMALVNVNIFAQYTFSNTCISLYRHMQIQFDTSFE